MHGSKGYHLARGTPRYRCGHLEPGEVALPKGFRLECRLGQWVEVRCPRGHRYLLAETETHFELHRRVTPDAPGHARNAIEHGPHQHAFPKPAP